jgi:hypothetical protein
MSAAFEEWRAAPGTLGLYEVSSLGRTRNKAGHVMRNNTGSRRAYRMLTFRVDGRRKMLLVHRLVCEAFNGRPPFKGAQVRHLDGDSLNNIASNLRWGTAGENTADKIQHGVIPRGSNHGRAILCEDDVSRIRERWAERDRDYGAMIALGREYGVSSSTVSCIVKRRIWKHVA